MHWGGFAVHLDDRTWPGESWTRRAARSEQAGDPAPDARLVVEVRLAEALGETALVAEHAELEPDDRVRGDRGRERRAQRQREADEEDDVAEVHRVAAPRERPARDQALGRGVHAGTAAAASDAVPAHEVVLQVAPGEERQIERVDVRRRAAADRELPGDHDRRIQQEGPERRAAETIAHVYRQGRANNSQDRYAISTMTSGSTIAITVRPAATIFALFSWICSARSWSRSARSVWRSTSASVSRCAASASAW